MVLLRRAHRGTTRRALTSPGRAAAGTSQEPAEPPTLRRLHGHEGAAGGGNGNPGTLAMLCSKFDGTVCTT